MGSPLALPDTIYIIEEFEVFEGGHLDPKSPTISTHKVDADVDEARSYLLQDLVFSQHVKKWGYVQGIGKTRLDENRENLTGDTYFTDGLRVVLMLIEEPTTIDQIERFDWERLIDHYDKNLGH